MQSLANRLIRTSLVSLLVVAVFAVAPHSPAADAPLKPVQTKKPRGRLPAYYAKVVTQEQREQVYRIQEEYEPKIDALEKQLGAIRKEREEKIAAVLTLQQRKQVEEATAAARANRANARQRRAESKPAQPAATEPATKANSDK